MVFDGIRVYKDAISENCFSYKNLLRNDFTGRPGYFMAKLWEPAQRGASFMSLVDEKAVKAFDL